MKAAKIISFIGGILSLIIFIFSISAINKLAALYENLYYPSEFNFLPRIITVILLSLFVTTANFGYFYYLIKKERNGNKVEHSLIYSIIIMLAPIIVLMAVIIWAVFLPVYITTMIK